MKVLNKDKQEIKNLDLGIVEAGKSKEYEYILYNESLAEVAVGVGFGEVKAITFYAPSESGEYEFYCD